MADVAAVASVLIANVLPNTTVRGLLALHEDPLTAFRQLLWVVALHDWGKSTPGFARKVPWAVDALTERGFDFDLGSKSRNHGDLGYKLLTPELVRLGASKPLARRLARAVCAHHGQFPTNQGAQREPSGQERGRNAVWDAARRGIVNELEVLFGPPGFEAGTRVAHAFVMQLAGLTAVADWIGSMQSCFPYETPPPSLREYWPRALMRAQTAVELAGFGTRRERPRRRFVELFPYDPWPLHVLTDDIAAKLDGPALVVVEAPMGEGKTEAALVLADAAASLGASGLYVGLPTQATANQMLGRVQRHLTASLDTPTTLSLAHSEASLVDLSAIYGEDEDAVVRSEAWFETKKRRLLAHHAVGTIDQALVSTMKVPHGFVRLFGLAGKTVILDEVHAYDTYTGTLLDRLLAWLAACGTTVVLLSATLPSARRRELVDAYRAGIGAEASEPDEAAYPRVTVASTSTSRSYGFESRRTPLPVRLHRGGHDIDDNAARLVEQVQEGGCGAWICNTVARAQAAFLAVQALAADVPTLLVHARLFTDDRQARQRQLEQWLGPKGTRPERCIVIGTQVLEQSLDVDFDFMFSDLAPIDLLLQRAGRLFRHAREDRSAARPEPELRVLCQPGAPLTAPVDEVAGVYAQDGELVLRRTLQQLEGQTHLTLPTDIAPWVERVYGRDALAPDDPLHEAWLEDIGARQSKRHLALEKLLPEPTVRDDPFGDLQVTLTDDDDPLLHQQLRAATRLGRDSLKVVLLERRGDMVCAGDEAIDLDRPLDRERVDRLVRRSIGVSRPDVVHTLNDDPSALPAPWSDSAILRHRRLVVLEDGEATVGRTTLRLDPQLGLVLS